MATPETSPELRDAIAKPIEDGETMQDYINRQNRRMHRLIKLNRKKITALNCDKLNIPEGENRFNLMKFILNPAPEKRGPLSLDECLSICQNDNNISTHIFECLYEAFICLGVGPFGDQNGEGPLMNKKKPSKTVDKRRFIVIDPNEKDKSANQKNTKQELVDFFKSSTVQATSGSKADIAIKVFNPGAEIDDRKNVDVCYYNVEEIQKLQETSKPAKREVQKYYSVKYFMKIRGAEKQDIEQLQAEKVDDHKSAGDEFHIYICANNGERTKEKLNNARRDIIRKMVVDVYGRQLLETHWGEYLDKIRLLTEELDEMEIKTPPVIYKPLLHQESIVGETIDALVKKGDRHFVWGAVARSGKTFMSAYLVKRLRNMAGDAKVDSKKIKSNKVLILTPFPTETMSQWFTEFNRAFEDEIGEVPLFNDDEKVCSRPNDCGMKGVSKEELLARLDKDRWLCIASSQKLVQGLISEGVNDNKIDIKDIEKDAEGEHNNELLQKIKSVKPDIIFFDEAHQAANNTAETTIRINEILKTDDITLIKLTATFGKIVEMPMGKNIKPKVCVWGVLHNDFMKRVAQSQIDELTEDPHLRENLANIYPGLPTGYFDDKTEEEIKELARYYETIPDMHFFLTHFTQYPEEGEDGKLQLAKGWSYKENFKLITTTVIEKRKNKDAKDGEGVEVEPPVKKFTPKFEKEGWILHILQQICYQPADEYDDAYPNTPSIFERIENSLIQEPYNEIVQLRDSGSSRKRPMTQLWFLPSGDEGYFNIGTLILALMKLIKDNGGEKGKLRSLYENFEFLSLNHVKNTKVAIHDREINVSNQFKEHLDGGHFHYLITKDLKSEVKKYEREAFSRNRMLICLTAMRATTGITFPCVDVIGLFDQMSSPDLTFQKIYRAMTPRPKKGAAFIFDINPQRTMRSVYEQGMNERSLGLDIVGGFKEDFVSDILLVDRDLLSIQETGKFNDLLKEQLGMLEDVKKGFVGDRGGFKTILGNTLLNTDIFEDLDKIIQIGTQYKKSKENVNTKRIKLPIDESITADQKKNISSGLLAIIDEIKDKYMKYEVLESFMKEPKPSENEWVNMDAIERNKIMIDILIPDEKAPFFSLLIGSGFHVHMEDKGDYHFRIKDIYRENGIQKNIKDCLKKLKEIIKLIRGDLREQIENQDIQRRKIVTDIFSRLIYIQAFIHEPTEDIHVDLSEFKDNKELIDDLDQPYADGMTEEELPLKGEMFVLWKMQKQMTFSSFNLKGVGKRKKTLQIFIDALNIFGKPQIKSSIISIMKGVPNIKTDSVSKVLDFFKSKLTPRDEEKNKYGEVFTPESLIGEMLDKVPTDFWKNKDVKVLDPAAGYGQFSLIALEKFMDGLKSEIPNEQRRREHIIKNILYQVELNPASAKIIKNIYGKEANVHQGSFLEKLPAGWPEKQDLIMGNPPFNEEQRSKTGPRQGGQGKLYEKFIINAISILHSGGLLDYVTPLNFLNGCSNKTYQTIIEKNVKLISLNKITERFFPQIGIDTCYFLLENCNYKNRTRIINDPETFNVTLKCRPVNPIMNWSQENETLFDNFIGIKENGFKRTKNQIVKKTPNGIKVIVNKDKYFYTKDSNVQGYSIPKILLFRMKPLDDPILDKTGEFGLNTDQIYFIDISKLTNKEITELYEYFKSDFFKKLIKLTKTSQYLKDSFIKYVKFPLKETKSPQSKRKTKGKVIRNVTVRKTAKKSSPKSQKAGKRVRRRVSRKRPANRFQRRRYRTLKRRR